MQRKFLSNLTLLLLLNLLIKPAYLLLVETEVQNRVGSEVYGNYAALLSLTFLLNIFLDLGLNTFTSRTLAQKNHLASNYIGHVAGLRSLLVLIYFVLLFVSALFLGYEQEDYILLTWLGVNQLLAASVLYIRSNLNGLLLFKSDAVISILDKGLLLIGLGYLLIDGDPNSFDLYYMVWGQTIAYGVALIVATLLLVPKIGQVKLRWSPFTSRTILKQSLPYALLVLLMMVYYKTDAVMLERMLPEGDFYSGVYAMSYRLFEAANMVGYLFATLLLPLFSRALKQNESVSPLAGNAFRLILSGGLIVGVISGRWSDEILHMIYDHDVDLAAPCFVVLMASFFFMLMSYLWGTLLTANGDMRIMNRIATGAVILNITLNLILIPRYQAFGSAIASLFTQILVAVLQMVLSYRIVGVRLGKAVVRRSLIFIVLVGISLYLTTIIDLQWQLLGVVFGALCLGLAFVTGLLRLDYVKSLLGKAT